jgi:hypothetical protein
MIRRILRYALFSLFAAVTPAPAVLTVRSFWVADVWCCQGEDIQSPGGLWLGTRYVLSSGWGRFYLVADYQHPAVRYSRGGMTTWSAYHFTQALADFRPIMFMPTHSRDYVLFWHGTVVGQPLISSFRDLTGKSDMLRERDIIVPAWVPLGLGGSACVLLFFPIWRRWRMVRGTRQGLCMNCGYDLRAHQAGERCPECGTVKAGAK